MLWYLVLLDCAAPRHRLKAGDMIASNEFLPGEVDYLIEGGRRRCRKRPVRGRSGDR
jgi:hypothetical protein